MSVQIQGKDIEIGQVIIFQSKSQYDTTTWKGEVLGFGGFSLVKGMEDLIPYHRGVEATHPSTTPDISNCYFVVLQVYENIPTDDTEMLAVKSGPKKAFAIEWMLDGTLKIDNTGKVFQIKLYNIEESAVTTALQLLRNNGYTCSK